ncbi:hypothetical protein bcgnr5378_05860 [Bacillus cereus]|uniref:Uncharacterized protein n=1 Tax=Bacillus cereus TaxID=1396 RepID=A0A164LBN1_BACCE|nr:hypothetical protein [Bacillus cereus]KZD55640.1 hypothetical protein B4088_5385 [Bacillus cereus]
MKVILFKDGKIHGGYSNHVEVTKMVNEMINNVLEFEVTLENNNEEYKNVRSLRGNEFKLRVAKIQENASENTQMSIFDELSDIESQINKLQACGLYNGFENDTEVLKSMFNLSFKCAIDDMTVKIIDEHGEIIYTGIPCNAKEEIETMLCKKLGFNPDLEAGEEDEFTLYLHTEGCEHLDDEQIEKLDEIGITEDEESTTKAIEDLLKIKFEYSY